MSKALLLVGLFMLAALQACAGSTGADEGQVRELKNENAELREDLEEAQEEIGELEAELASAEAAQETEGGSSESASASSSASASASSGVPMADKDCEVDKKCELVEGAVTVTNIEITDTVTSEYSGSVSGNFVVVDAEYEYGGTAPTETQEIPWILEDNEGRAFTYDSDTTIEYADQSLIYEEVQPGVVISGRTIFAVPPDAEIENLYVGDLVNPQGGDVGKIEVS